MSAREGREPFNGALYGASQFLILIAMVPSLLPKPLRLGSMIFASWVAYKMIFTQTTGDMGGDLGLGSAVLQQLLIGIDFALVTDPTSLKELSDKNPTLVTARPSKDRLIWALKLYVNPRGIGWAHEPLYLPNRPSPLMPRLKFVVSRFTRMVGCILLECVIYVVDASNPGMTTPGMVLSQAPLKWRALGVACFVVAGACRLNAMHTGLSALVVGCGFSSPDRWPNFFGSPFDAWQLKILWRKVWHQNVRKSVLGCTSAVMSIFPVPTSTFGITLYKLSRLYVTFFLVGAAHVGGDRMLTGKLGAGAFKLFMLQPLGLTLEFFADYLWCRFIQQFSPPLRNKPTPLKTNGYFKDPTKSTETLDIGGYGNVGLRGYNQHRGQGRDTAPTWVRFVGLVWVAVWAVWTVAFMVDPMCSVGMFTDPRVDLRQPNWFSALYAKSRHNGLEM
ncbi:hypothetical protein CPB83DRAFT_864924 [Crepidotus variabilis]|uniref:Wax synthase domain-containing protein n=1 Tax=Crepidotus variabilis TaxID=179855 RepID=A0A9P6E4A5_9AGAR|nr:hypothetical protein CPB83DRAFT_864924 [Crepidotus variabilis]